MGRDKKILLLGAGGHCLSVLDSLLTSYEYQSIGIIDKEKQGNGVTYIMGIPILGCDEDLEQLRKEGYTQAFITIGSIGNIKTRRKLYHLIKALDFQIPNIIDRTSIISKSADLGEGIYVGKNAVINAKTEIGSMAIVNTSSTVEHECSIGEYVHIAPGSVICGNVSVGQGTHIGACSVIRQGIHIGQETMIGCGSVVVGDIAANVTAYGNPCRVKVNSCDKIAEGDQNER